MRRFLPLRHSVLLLALLSLAACEVRRDAAPAPVLNFGNRVDSQTGAMMVQRGDTVYAVSQRYNLPLRDIIDLNGLVPPYHLAAGQRLRLPAPREHKVGDRDTLHSLSRMYNVPLSELVRINRLAPPYRLNVGQVMRLPSSLRAPSVAKAPVRTPPAGQKKTEVTPVAKAQEKRKPVVVADQPIARSGYTWPVRGKIISSYGAKEGQLFNDGINIAAPRGTAVVSAADGVVAYVGDSLASYGNLVLIRHADGVVTAYAHLAGVQVAKGDRVAKGQKIGTVGSTGNVDSAQLHFEVRQGTKTINPRKFLG